MTSSFGAVYNPEDLLPAYSNRFLTVAARYNLKLSASSADGNRYAESVCDP